MDFEAKKIESKSKFIDLEKERTLLLARIQEITVEQLRLQGEFRLLEEFTKPVIEPETKPEEPKP